jgi:hypothetical protein
VTPDAFEPLIRQFATGSRLLDAQPLTGGISAGMTAATIERAAGWLDLGRPDVTLQTMQADHARFVEEATVRLFTA